MNVLEKKVFEQDRTNARKIRFHLYETWKDFIKKKEKKEVCENDRADFLLEIKSGESYAKQMMTDFHFANAFQRQGEKLLVAEKEVVKQIRK